MVSSIKSIPKYAEFFAGGGMVSAALGGRWSCAFANDIDAMKCDVYRANWGQDVLVSGDIRDVPASALMQPIDLFWASSPCQDFSLAGKGLGLSGQRSGVFVPWFEHVQKAVEMSFAPAIIAFENVPGLVSRNGGRDFKHIVQSFMKLGYNVGAVEIDAKHFLPQSRQRVFVIACRSDMKVDGLVADRPDDVFHSPRLRKFVDDLPKRAKSQWVWWSLPTPKARKVELADIFDENPDTKFFTQAEVRRLLAMMTPHTLDKIKKAQAAGSRMLGTLYRRGRPNNKGVVEQRAEVRFDGIAGCLRTPAGGSSRQTILIVEGDKIKARLLSSRELVGLMGLPADYQRPQSYNDTYRVAGDGVAVPVVEFLDRNLFLPLLAAKQARKAA
jgi:DNA (cytosine-5)-methyltransferase 1